MIKSIFFSILVFFLGSFFLGSLTAGVIIGTNAFLVYRIMMESTRILVFREWVLLLYAINYLLSPMITYSVDQSLILYPMKISSQHYFELAIPGFFLFAAGMYTLKSGIFTINMERLNKSISENVLLLLRVTQLGILLKFFSFLFAGELEFLLYLLSLVRYVGALSLFSLNGKYSIWIGIVLMQEMAGAFIGGLYHDAIMWLVFCGIFYLFCKKPNFKVRLLAVLLTVIFIFFIQGLKSSYRDAVWSGERAGTINTASEIGSEVISQNRVFDEGNFISTLNRSNQAWILASTIDNLDRTRNFQQLNNWKLYLEAAILPRIIAPNKLKSTDKSIFNEFSGHTINANTSMGLGIFADGYISYSTWGLYFFGYLFGLFFSLTFKLIEKWSKISPFYLFFLFPVLNYAVRPDCETQTIINHIVKSLLLYGFLVKLSKYRFTLNSR